MTHDDMTDVDIDHIVQYARTIALHILQINLIKRIKMVIATIIALFRCASNLSVEVTLL